MKERAIKPFFAGVAAVVILGALVVLVAVEFGYLPAKADTPPFPMEKWAAHTALNAQVAREAPQPPYPFGPVTDATLFAGAKLYIQNCAVCHGSAGAEESNVAKGFYIPAPQFTKHGVDDDPEGETYWKLEHGIRFTGMPSFRDNLTEEQIWQITYFLKHGTKSLPKEADAVWHQPHGD